VGFLIGVVIVGFSVVTTVIFIAGYKYYVWKEKLEKEGQKIEMQLPGEKSISKFVETN
jgi:hypothetical protein